MTFSFHIKNWFYFKWSFFTFHSLKCHLKWSSLIFKWHIFEFLRQKSTFKSTFTFLLAKIQLNKFSLKNQLCIFDNFWRKNQIFDLIVQLVFKKTSWTYKFISFWRKNPNETFCDFYNTLFFQDWKNLSNLRFVTVITSIWRRHCIWHRKCITNHLTFQLHFHLSGLWVANEANSIPRN